MARKYAVPGSREFAWWYAQKRRRDRKAEDSKRTPEIEFLTSAGEFFETSEGETLVVQDAS